MKPGIHRTRASSIRQGPFDASPTKQGRHRGTRSEEHTSELQSQSNLVCRLLLEKKNDEVVKALPKILPVLRRKTGHDFSRYKQSTLVRRIQRRMQVLYFESAAKYLENLQRDPKEVDNLFKDLLIGVTQFFRDAEAFEALGKQVIPEIFRDKRADNQVRIWVTGCATGEEAYSIAILIAEHLAQLESPPQVQIFATDLDEEALEGARKGPYQA